MRGHSLPIALVSALLAGGVLCAQDPLRTLPNNYRLIFENQTVRVIRVTYRPAEKLPVHDHPKTPTVYAYLTDSGPVRFSHLEDKPFTIERKPLKAGTFRVSPGRLEVHEVENLGDTASEFLRIELRQVPLGFPGGAYRDSKPLRLTASAVTEEFHGPGFRIERLVAVRERAAIPADVTHPSLLVAFTAASLKNGARRDVLPAGEVRWMPALQTVDITRGPSAAANVLRIVFDER